MSENKTLYEKRREDGKCGVCGEPARPGKATCQGCQDRRRVNERRHVWCPICRTYGHPKIDHKRGLIEEPKRRSS